jgi:PAS domain S-box-containing protein
MGDLLNSVQQLWIEQVGGVLETLNQGVIINNECRQVVYANSRFLEMIQMSAADLLGQSIMNLYPPDDVPPLLEFIARRETEGRAQYEYYIPQADGGRLPVAVTSRASGLMSLAHPDRMVMPTTTKPLP